MPADELAGSAVGKVAAPDLIAAKLTDVIANLRGWAVAARMAADAFERADVRSARPLSPPMTRPTVPQAQAWQSRLVAAHRRRMGEPPEPICRPASTAWFAR